MVGVGRTCAAHLVLVDGAQVLAVVVGHGGALPVGLVPVVEPVHVPLPILLPLPLFRPLGPLVLLPLAFVLVVYALATFHWRSAKIKNREPVRWDDPVGPLVLGAVMTCTLTIYFFIKLGTIWA